MADHTMLKGATNKLHNTQTATQHLYAPAQESLLAEILQGLQKPQKELPPKLFYDERGSQLFEQICELEEYYLTRTESGIMRRHAAEMATLIGPYALLLEYGSGSSKKTRILLDQLQSPSAYVAIDISREHLLHSTALLAAAYPKLRVIRIWADYTQPLELPQGIERYDRRIVYFPGSTIGNFYPDEAVVFLDRIAHVVGEGGGLLVGVDLKKDAEVLKRAYNDRAGVTAAFNLNVLARLNREFGADFPLDQFAHRAWYNERAGRIEMHLVSRTAQKVHVGGVETFFRKDESILTEVSYKYTLEEFAMISARAGFRVAHVWTDAERQFSVQYLIALDHRE